jgi:ribonuclease PH
MEKISRNSRREEEKGNGKNERDKMIKRMTERKLLSNIIGLLL